ncbi:MAG: DUF3726 domain-containing protein [Roseovarius sp.]
MTWSLGELEALARKAARGAGMSWGMAEEAGCAARWLCAAGLPGGESLADLLAWAEGRDWADLRPESNAGGGRWRARGPRLCPIATGTALCDAAGSIGPALALGPVAQPLLLAPFAAWAAEARATPSALSWPGARLRFGPGGALIEAEGGAALRARHAAKAALGDDPEAASGAASGPGSPALAGATRAEIGPAAARILQAFAARTYAPETAERRLAGAGAGLADQD